MKNIKFKLNGVNYEMNWNSVRVTGEGIAIKCSDSYGSPEVLFATLNSDKTFAVEIKDFKNTTDELIYVANFLENSNLLEAMFEAREFEAECREDKRTINKLIREARAAEK